jgi:trk system potassium uptake protein TrkA
MKRFVIVGLGNFGSSVAEALYRDGQDVIALDIDEAAVDRMAPHCSRAAVGDGRDTETLQRIGADEADAAVISTGDDITSSLLTTLSLKDLGVEEIYVKVISHDHARVMKRLEVTETVFPERDSGVDLAIRISDRGVVNYVRMSGVSIQEMVVRDDWVGTSLRDLKLRAEYDLSVVAVHNLDTDRVTTPPDPDDPLRKSDTLLVAGTETALDRVADRD